MTKTNDMTAFPVERNRRDGRPGIIHEEGMKLRDYFVGQAIIGVCVNSKDTAELDDRSTEDAIATLAYRIADAMLKSREVKND